MIFFSSLRAPSDSTPTLEPKQWVARHGDILFRYTLGRVRNPDLAENLVQETFLSALKSLDGFSGNSSERTWLFGILKHKLMDHYRKSGRETPTDDPDSAVDPANALFTQRGHWAVGPVNWSDPEGALESEAFWQILSKCLSNLPKRLQACFQMWEVDGLDTQEVCKELSMTETNLWVSLHRARLKLRGCLESNWFQDTEEK